MAHDERGDPRRRTIRVVTYNIHRCRGLDGRTIPLRIAEVLQDLQADVIALQEVIGAGPHRPSQAEEIGAALGMGWTMASTRTLRGALFGNVVLSRFPVRTHLQYDLSWKTCEARTCQRVDLDVGDRALHVYNCHLGTAYLERRFQAEKLGAIVQDRRVTGPKIVLGDFNEWTKGLTTQILTEKLESIDISAHLQRRRTYPGILPLVHLDHIYYQGQVEVVGMSLPRTRRVLIASDHLPLVADLKIGF